MSTYYQDALYPLGAIGDFDSASRENKYKGVRNVWGWEPPTKREMAVAIIFVIPISPLFLLNTITFQKLNSLERIVNWYGEHIVQRVAEWANKF